MIFRKVKVRINLRKCNRNIYIILGYVKTAMIKANKEEKYEKLWNKVVKSKTYDEALKIIKKYVKIIDTSNLIKSI